MARGRPLNSPNRRPAQWAVALDVLHEQEPPCMTRKQWTLYLSGAAAECMANRIEAQRVARSGRVNPCAECAQGFKAAAEARGACQPQWFMGEAAACSN